MTGTLEQGLPGAVRPGLRLCWRRWLCGDDEAAVDWQAAPWAGTLRPPWRAAVQATFPLLEGWRPLVEGREEAADRVIASLVEGLDAIDWSLRMDPEHPLLREPVRDAFACMELPAEVFGALAEGLLDGLAANLEGQAPRLAALRVLARRMAGGEGPEEPELALDEDEPPTPDAEGGAGALAEGEGGPPAGGGVAPSGPPSEGSGGGLSAASPAGQGGPGGAADHAAHGAPEAPGVATPERVWRVEVERPPEWRTLPEAPEGGPVVAGNTHDPVTAPRPGGDPVTAPRPGGDPVTAPRPGGDPVTAPRLPVAPADPGPGVPPGARAEALKGLLSARIREVVGLAVEDWETERISAQLPGLALTLGRKQETVRRLRGLLGVELEYLGIGDQWGKGLWMERTWRFLETYAELAEKNPALRRLVEMLGRYEAARTAREVVSEVRAAPRPLLEIRRGGFDQLRGVHFSADIERLTTGEQALLTDPDLEILFYLRLLDAQLLTLEFVGEQALALAEPRREPRPRPEGPKKGPIILCLDTSASMSGEPEVVSKTIALAMLRVALQERRPCWAISYSHTADLQEIELTRMPEALGDLLGFLAMGFRGGTDPVPALQAAFRRLDTATFDRADILWITDGVFTVPPAFEQHVREVRADREVRIHTLLVGEAVVPEFVDYCWRWSAGRSFADGGLDLIYGLRETPA